MRSGEIYFYSLRAIRYFYSLFAIRYSLFAIRYSLFAIRYSLPLQRLALQQPRHFAGKARRLADEQAFQRRRAIDQAEADIAHRAQ
ncbi:MAG: hypothetical protein QOF07_2354 [Bradyrhizobium sp.]|nr:hypothetical protein [Bradyrhizobium sp.]